MGQNVPFCISICNAEEVCCNLLWWRDSNWEECGDTAHLKCREPFLNCGFRVCSLKHLGGGLVFFLVLICFYFCFCFPRKVGYEFHWSWGKVGELFHTKKCFCFAVLLCNDVFSCSWKAMFKLCLKRDKWNLSKKSKLLLYILHNAARIHFYRAHS